MIKLFTHNDLDGVGCAVLAMLAFGSNKDLEIDFCGYDDINSKVEDGLHNNEYDEFHITDISINEETANKINESGKKCYLLDHHSTALDLNKFEWCNVKIEDENTGIKTSGTEMYYNWLVDNGYLTKDATMDRFVEIVRDYDTWRWASLGDDGIICKKINDLFYIYGKQKFINWCIMEINEKAFPMLYEADELVLETKQKEIDDYIEEKSKHLFIGNLCGRVCGFVFADKYISELGNKLCQKYSEFDFVAIINMDGTISYRTAKNDINLGEDIAKRFGGGGHSMAAGSQISKDIQMEVIKKIFS